MTTCNAMKCMFENFQFCYNVFGFQFDIDVNAKNKNKKLALRK